jgi:hypothetical protein
VTVGLEQARILGQGLVHAVTPLPIGSVNLRPRRRQKDAAMITVGVAERRQRRLACQVLKRRRSINQAPIEEHPTIQRIRCCSIGKGHRNSATRKSNIINPRKSGAAARQLFPHDPPPGLFHHCVPSPPEFGDHGRFATTRAAGDYDKSLYHAAVPTRLLLTIESIRLFTVYHANEHFTPPVTQLA